jgi:integrase
MAEKNETQRDFFIVLLLTGARRSNCEAMAWKDIDLAGGYWRIPGSEAKGGKPVIIPLSPLVHDILKRRREATKSQWVFSSGNRGGHIVDPKWGWKRIIKRAGLQDVRPHDLRRTLGSWQALLGASETLIGKTLGHAPGSHATSVYARLSLDPVRESVNGVEAAILTAAKRTPALLPMPEETDQPEGQEGGSDD